MREFFSTGEPCKAGCAYCFARWNSEYCVQSLSCNGKKGVRRAVVYPSCDGDFFERKQNISMVKKLAETMDNMYVSVSTKCAITPDVLKALCDLNSFLRQENKGFVKVSMSITTKSMIDEIEPGTLHYEDRLMLLKEIANLGFPTSITLKPILPLVADCEYFSIIDDCQNVVQKILTGGLYVNSDSEFFGKYIKGKYETEYRTVSWLPGRPTWLYVSQEEKISRIEEYARSRGIEIYESDIDLVESYITNEED